MSPRERKRIKCKIDELPLEMRAQVDTMLSDVTIGYREISEALRDEGYDISKSSIARYGDRVGRALTRAREAKRMTDSIVEAARDHRGLELSEAATAIMMDNVMQVLVDADYDDYAEIPLPKMLDLLLKQQRNAVYKERMVRSYRRDIELMRQAIMAELAEEAQHDPELVDRLESKSRAAAEKVVEQYEQQGGQ